MSIYKEKIVNGLTGEESWRDYTEQEIAEVEQAKIEAATYIENEKKKALERIAILEKLGITEDEARLLLG